MHTYFSWDMAPHLLLQDLETLLQAIIKAQAEGIMADILDVARCKASQLQTRLSRLAVAAAF